MKPRRGGNGCDLSYFTDRAGRAAGTPAARAGAGRGAAAAQGFDFETWRA